MILSAGTCIADYHQERRTFSPVLIKAAAAASVSDLQELLSDTEEHLKAADGTLKTSELRSYSWLSVQRLSQANN